ncbi:MAG: glycosyltransferase family 4 protein [Planctomycetota bacterium]
MRVLFLNATGFIGGAERQLLHMMASLKRCDPDIDGHLITLGDGDLVREGRGIGWTVHPVLLPERLAQMGDSSLRDGGKFVRTIALLVRAAGAMPDAAGHLIELRRTIRAINPDVIHSNGIKTHLLGSLVFPKGIPVVWHLHDYYSLRPLAARLLKLAKRGIAAAVAISESVRRDSETILKGVRIPVILNGVDVERCSPGTVDAGKLDALAGIDSAKPGTIRVGLVATFARWKGQDVFLEAAQLVMKLTTRPVRFYIVGGAIYHTANQFSLDELKDAAVRAGIQNDVAFVPFQNDVAEVYRALDCVIHASTLPEPFGLTIVEAMACGRAVVVSNAGGAGEIVSEGHDALGTPPGDADALAQAIARLVEDAELRTLLGRNARATVLSRFDANRLGGQLLDVYRSVMTS